MQQYLLCNDDDTELISVIGTRMRKKGMQSEKLSNIWSVYV